MTCHFKLRLNCIIPFVYSTYTRSCLPGVSVSECDSDRVEHLWLLFKYILKHSFGACQGYGGWVRQTFVTSFINNLWYNIVLRKTPNGSHRRIMQLVVFCSFSSCLLVFVSFDVQRSRRYNRPCSLLIQSRWFLGGP